MCTLLLFELFKMGYFKCLYFILKEEKADVLSNYINAFQRVDCAFLYIDTFFQTMAREWLAIDRYRLEKFMMVSILLASFKFIILINLTFLFLRI